LNQITPFLSNTSTQASEKECLENLWRLKFEVGKLVAGSIGTAQLQISQHESYTVMIISSKSL